MSALHEAKVALRKRVLAARDAMPPSQRKLDSILLCGRLNANIRYRRARAVLAYVGFGSEVDTEPFLKTVLADGKVLALPRIDKARNVLTLYRVTDLAADLEPGPWGIREPSADPSRIFALREADFVLTPGLAFDAECNRMGYGKAYYDRLFADCPGAVPYRLALAFDCQVVDRVPVGTTDVQLDAVITPSREYSH
ncbi:MAG: 5-formyltetrahydrofolate cyclo-ligase [Betaproteobacteria bacterium]|nr:5-formyltetrahydrofolate cyclo-ligase [Betaproteobacteria bacterium]